MHCFLLVGRLVDKVCNRVSVPKATEMLGKLNLGRKPSGSFEQSSFVKNTLGSCTVSRIRGEEGVLNLSLNSLSPSCPTSTCRKVLMYEWIGNSALPLTFCHLTKSDCPSLSQFPLCDGKLRLGNFVGVLSFVFCLKKKKS